MILVDTCIWVDFFRGENLELADLLAANEVVMHWIVIGELAVDNLPRRAQILNDLRVLERVQEATAREALALLENQKLYGKGLSWNDVQLLASALIHSVPLWTKDIRLRDAAQKTGALWR